jgi:adenine deaminase
LKSSFQQIDGQKAYERDNVMMHLLHVSDLHFGTKENAQQWYDKLATDLKMELSCNPISNASTDRITDHGFLEILAQNGFCVCFHGHLRKTVSELFRYDYSAGGRKIEIVGAGTFGAPTKDWFSGYPLHQGKKIPGTDLESVRRLIQAARGDRPADLLLCNARLVNVYLGAVEQKDIVVADGMIVGFGDCPARERIDLKGRFVAPGFIDSHVHMESAMLAPAEFARAVLPHGTTAVVADPHEIANVLGIAGIDYMLQATESLPLNVFLSLPSCVPASALETAGAVLKAADMTPYLRRPRVVALAEMMDFHGVIHEDDRVLAKIDTARKAGKRLDGHAPGLTGRMLHAYLVTGIGSDHECTTLAEAREKLAAGMVIMVRQGSAARNLDALLPLADAHTARRMMWCTDDCHPHDLLAKGHIDSLVRRSIARGLDPIVAIQMATLNPAEYFRLDHLGAVAPGKRADLVVFNDLNHPVIQQVYAAGQLVADQGAILPGILDKAAPEAPAAMNVPLSALDFKVPAQGRALRVIEVVRDQIVTKAVVMDATIAEGMAVSDVKRDLLKIAVIERHHHTGRTGIGFIRGFGLKSGALASSVAHDAHNIVVVGVSDEDIRRAVEAVVKLGGGLAAVVRGRIQAALPLPIAGLMSDQPEAVVRRRLDDLLAAARRMGSNLSDPFMTLSFMALPVVPALKITDHGLVDVAAVKIVPLFDDAQGPL